MGLIKRLTDDGIVVTLRQEKYLLAMRYWAHYQVQSDTPIVLALFTLEVANNHTCVMNSESSETEISEVTVKAPQKFTGALAKLQGIAHCLPWHQDWCIRSSILLSHKCNGYPCPRCDVCI